MNAGFTAEYDDAEASKLLGRLSAFCARPVEATAKVAHVIAERSRLTFHDQADPWGNPWAALSPATLAKRRGGGRGGVSILRDTGQLLASLTDGVAGDEAVVHIGFSDRPATIHQFGGQAGRGRKVNIPARPMLPIRGNTVDLPPSWRDEVIEVLNASIAAAVSA